MSRSLTNRTSLMMSPKNRPNQMNRIPMMIPTSPMNRLNQKIRKKILMIQLSRKIQRNRLNQLRSLMNQTSQMSPKMIRMIPTSPKNCLNQLSWMSRMFLTRRMCPMSSTSRLTWMSFAATPRTRR